MKQRILALALLIFALWPLAQRVLVARYDVSPWKLFGWAMYAAPRYPLRIFLYGSVDGDPEFRITTLSPVAYEAVLDYKTRRAGLGTLVSQGEMARAVLRERPDLDILRVVVEVRKLDRVTARTRVDREETLHPRSEEALGLGS